MTGLPASVEIRDCSPRDGLQPLPPLAAEDRVSLVEDLFASGLADVEVGAFVSPKAVPAMAGSGEVVASVTPAPDRRCWALVPNARGAQLALDAGIEHLTVTVSASEEYSRRNVGMSVDESLVQVAQVRELARDQVVDAVVSCAFGSPFDDHVTASWVAEVCSRLSTIGVDRLTLADTTGVATPRRIELVLSTLILDVGLHLHDTRGTALTNAYAALRLGVHRFDTSLGGLGGSPFAPEAGGNLATEDLVLLLGDLGVATGVELAALLAAGERLAVLIGRQLPSRVAKAGALPEFEAS
ncbi:MAG TPA: hydroxymethylglutaryl-CoA lyase [Acidimicrobiia bacterium]|nr:hydroxymethylglutaryl-CoA lyase [Acidimicrobiia bacterium]